MPELPEVYPTPPAPPAWQDGNTFRESFLLYVQEEAVKDLLRVVGRALFDAFLNARLPDFPEGVTVAELRAALADLRHLQGYLAGIGREEEEAAPLTEPETVLSRLAARQAVELARIADDIDAALDVAAAKEAADTDALTLPLEWREQDFTAVRTDDGHAYSPHTVRGPVAGPFGIYRGCYAVPHDPARERNVFTLCHVPTGRNLCTLPRVRDCKALAEELAALPLRWHDADPEKVIGSEEASAPFREIVSRYRRAALPPRLRDIDTPEHLR